MAPILDPVNFFWVFSLISHCGQKGAQGACGVGVHQFLETLTWNYLDRRHISTPRLMDSDPIDKNAPFQISSSVFTQNASLNSTISIWYINRVSKKMSSTELSIFRFAKNIISISSQLAAESPNAQFGKTQFLWDTLYKKKTTFHQH